MSNHIEVWYFILYVYEEFCMITSLHNAFFIVCKLSITDSFASLSWSIVKILKIFFFFFYNICRTECNSSVIKKKKKREREIFGNQVISLQLQKIILHTFFCFSCLYQRTFWEPYNSKVPNLKSEFMCTHFILVPHRATIFFLSIGCFFYKRFYFSTIYKQ